MGDSGQTNERATEEMTPGGWGRLDGFVRVAIVLAFVWLIGSDVALAVGLAIVGGVAGVFSLVTPLLLFLLGVTFLFCRRVVARCIEDVRWGTRHDSTYTWVGWSLVIGPSGLFVLTDSNLMPADGGREALFVAAVAVICIWLPQLVFVEALDVRLESFRRSQGGNGSPSETLSESGIAVKISDFADSGASKGIVDAIRYDANTSNERPQDALPPSTQRPLAPTAPFQFTIRGMLMLMTVVAITLAVGQMIGYGLHLLAYCILVVFLPTMVTGVGRLFWSDSMGCRGVGAVLVVVCLLVTTPAVAGTWIATRYFAVLGLLSVFWFWVPQVILVWFDLRLIRKKAEQFDIRNRVAEQGDR